MKKIIVFGMTVALLTSCASTEKLLERGNYEELISKATRILTGKKKKDQVVYALEEGYKKLSIEVMARIESYKLSNTPESWESALSLAYTIDRVQNKINPLLPLVSENGHRAKFKFIGTIEIIAVARKSAAALYHARLNGLVNEAYAGNKPAAREAYYLVDRINSLSNEYELVKTKNEMYHAGINKIWVSIEDRSYNRLPLRVYDELNYLTLRNDINDWNQYYTEMGEAVEPDYKVVYNIHDLRAENEQYHTSENKYWKEITDGWDYVLDAKGNVVKDSLGNDIKRDRRIKVNATLSETILSKRAYISGYMEVIHMRTGNVSFSRPLDFEDWFTHTSRNYYGDPRALDAHMALRIDPVHCPDDVNMMLQVADKAKRAFVYEVKRINYL